jgi:hypothetical protein
MNQHRCKSDSHRYSPKITDGEPARFFLCAGCRAQVLICSDCDRGQIYCNEGCACEIRRRNQREAGRRYQRSSKGRATHAERSRRYRARRRNVTHQGPPQPPQRGRASGRPAATVAPTSTRRSAPTPLKYSCAIGAEVPARGSSARTFGLHATLADQPEETSLITVLRSDQNLWRDPFDKTGVSGHLRRPARTPLCVLRWGLFRHLYADLLSR